MVRGEAEPIRGARGWVRVGWLACLIGWRLAAGTFEVGLDRESIEAGGTAVLVLSFSDFGEVEAPARAGELSLGPAEIETVFSVAPKRGGLFGDFFAEQRRDTFKSGSNSVTVIEPPVAGRPADYHGARAIGHLARLGQKVENAVEPGQVALRLAHARGQYRHRFQKHGKVHQEHHEVS